MILPSSLLNSFCRFFHHYYDYSLNLSRPRAILFSLFFLLSPLISYPKYFSSTYHFISIHVSASTAIQQLITSINSVLSLSYFLTSPFCLSDNFCAIALLLNHMALALSGESFFAAISKFKFISLY